MSWTFGLVTSRSHPSMLKYASDDAPRSALHSVHNVLEYFGRAPERRSHETVGTSGMFCIMRKAILIKTHPSFSGHANGRTI